MVAKTTHVFNTIGYHFYVNTPVVLFFHGGGIVSHDRRLIAPHIAQSALIRGWPLVSADYRLLPQTNGIDVLEDVKDAYAYVRTRLWGILNGTEGGVGVDKIVRNVIVVGASAGAFWTFQAGHYFQPSPLALLADYGSTTFYSNKVLTPSPILQSEIQHFLDEQPNSGFTRPAHQFDPASLLPDLSPDPEWKRPEETDEEKASMLRYNLYSWLLQNSPYPDLMEVCVRVWTMSRGGDYPRTILVHGDEDDMAPYQASVDVVKVIGPTPAKLFTVKGKKHAFDSGLYLGDPDLEVVEEAWRAVDDIAMKYKA